MAGNDMMTWYMLDGHFALVHVILCLKSFIVTYLQSFQWLWYLLQHKALWKVIEIEQAQKEECGSVEIWKSIVYSTLAKNSSTFHLLSYGLIYIQLLQYMIHMLCSTEMKCLFLHLYYLGTIRTVNEKWPLQILRKYDCINAGYYAVQLVDP